MTAYIKTTRKDSLADLIISVLGYRPKPASQIARLTGKNRKNVIETLKKLKKKGLVKQIGYTERPPVSSYGENPEAIWSLTKQEVK